VVLEELLQLDRVVPRWRSQDSADAPARALVSGFELLRADAAKVAVPA